MKKTYLSVSLAVTLGLVATHTTAWAKGSAEKDQKNWVEKKMEFTSSTENAKSCLAQLPPLVYQVALASEDTEAAMKPSLPYSTIHEISHKVKKDKGLEYHDVATLTTNAVSTKIHMNGFLDYSTLKNSGTWSYDHGKCNGTFTGGIVKN